MRFSEENSIRRNQYAVFKRKQHERKSACGFHVKQHKKQTLPSIPFFGEDGIEGCITGLGRKQHKKKSAHCFKEKTA